MPDELTPPLCRADARSARVCAWALVALLVGRAASGQGARPAVGARSPLPSATFLLDGWRASSALLASHLTSFRLSGTSQHWDFEPHSGSWSSTGPPGEWTAARDGKRYLWSHAEPGATNGYIQTDVLAFDGARRYLYYTDNRSPCQVQIYTPSGPLSEEAMKQPFLADWSAWPYDPQQLMDQPTRPFVPQPTATGPALFEYYYARRASLHVLAVETVGGIRCFHVRLPVPALPAGSPLAQDFWLAPYGQQIVPWRFQQTVDLGGGKTSALIRGVVQMDPGVEVADAFCPTGFWRFTTLLRPNTAGERRAYLPLAPASTTSPDRKWIVTPAEKSHQWFALTDLNRSLPVPLFQPGLDQGCREMVDNRYTVFHAPRMLRARAAAGAAWIVSGSVLGASALLGVFAALVRWRRSGAGR